MAPNGLTHEADPPDAMERASRFGKYVLHVGIHVLTTAIRTYRLRGSQLLVPPRGPSDPLDLLLVGAPFELLLLLCPQVSVDVVHQGLT